eukprot:CAMPEP_0119572802 /NCGR_PEP_ID=MMETSP1352-20130426/44801_1 /TAXON_ID=265584 /ORGANISM="Stauroneis constricta, Strain CCMP1120" /LENGTH=707 /DNA_ID=CAMNT_0007622489 /DNA_START=63 /DNA_END=2186 /DNA_ORIENTATION=-
MKAFSSFLPSLVLAAAVLCISHVTPQANAQPICDGGLGVPFDSPPDFIYPLLRGLKRREPRPGFDSGVAFLVGGNFHSIRGAEVEGRMVVLGDITIEADGAASLVQVGVGSQVFPFVCISCSNNNEKASHKATNAQFIFIHLCAFLVQTKDLFTTMKAFSSSLQSLVLAAAVLCISHVTPRANAQPICDGGLGEPFESPPDFIYPLLGGLKRRDPRPGFDSGVAFLVGGNFHSIRGAEVEGRMVVLGDITIEADGASSLVQAGVGSQVFPDGGDIIQVGGDFTIHKSVSLVLSPTANGGGTVTYGGALNKNGNQFWHRGVTFVNDPNIDLSEFDDAIADLIPASEYWATLPGNGVAVKTSNSIELSAGDSDCIQVFNFAPDFWNGFDSGFAVNVDASLEDKVMLFNVPAFPDGTAIIDGVTDWSDPFGGVDKTFSPAFSKNILWNFHDATHVELGNDGPTAMFPGSILAPQASLRMTVAGQQGRVIVGGDYVQDKIGSEAHNYPFDGECPLPPPPECNDPAPVPLAPPSDSTEVPTMSPTVTNAPTPCPEDEIKLVMKVGSTHWTGDIPIDIISQDGDTVTFSISNTWTTNSIDYYYVAFHEGMSQNCYLNEDVTQTQTFTYTATCRHSAPITLVELFVSDGDFIPELDDAHVPGCCHRPIEDQNPTVQYCFEIYCEPQCPTETTARRLASDGDVVAAAASSSLRGS